MAKIKLTELTAPPTQEEAEEDLLQSAEEIFKKLHDFPAVERELGKRFPGEYVGWGVTLLPGSGAGKDIYISVIYANKPASDLPSDFIALVPENFIIRQDYVPLPPEKKKPPSKLFDSSFAYPHPARVRREIAAREYRAQQIRQRAMKPQFS